MSMPTNKEHRRFRPRVFFDGMLPSAFFGDALQSTLIDETGAR